MPTEGPTEGPTGGEYDDAARPEADEPDEHRPDGLDLARSMMRGTSGAPAAPARRRKGGPGPGGAGTGAWRRRRGEPGVLSGAHPDDRDPQLLSGEIDRLVADRGWALDLRVRGVFARWADIVGPEIGAHSTPETLTDGALVVRTDSTAWATQLRLLSTEIVRRLNAELGPATVVTVEVLGPHAPKWKHGRLGLRDGRGPRDTYG